MMFSKLAKIVQGLIGIPINAEARVMGVAVRRSADYYSVQRPPDGGRWTPYQSRIDTAWHLMKHGHFGK